MSMTKQLSLLPAPPLTYLATRVAICLNFLEILYALWTHTDDYVSAV